MTDNKPFEKPVVVELGHVGKYRQIRSTREAAECLMTVWPLNRGQRHREALDTCLKALEGYRSTADARRALVEAAAWADRLDLAALARTATGLAPAMLPLRGGGLDS